MVFMMGTAKKVGSLYQTHSKIRSNFGPSGSHGRAYRGFLEGRGGGRV